MVPKQVGGGGRERATNPGNSFVQADRFPSAKHIPTCEYPFTRQMWHLVTKRGGSEKTGLFNLKTSKSLCMSLLKRDGEILQPEGQHFYQQQLPAGEADDGFLI